MGSFGPTAAYNLLIGLDILPAMTGRCKLQSLFGKEFDQALPVYIRAAGLRSEGPIWASARTGVRCTPASSVPSTQARFNETRSLQQRVSLARKEPSAQRVPLAQKEPSAQRVPLAQKEPSAQRGPLAQKEPSAQRVPLAQKKGPAKRTLFFLLMNYSITCSFVP